MILYSISALLLAIITGLLAVIQLTKEHGDYKNNSTGSSMDLGRGRRNRASADRIKDLCGK